MQGCPLYSATIGAHINEVIAKLRELRRGEDEDEDEDSYRQRWFNGYIVRMILEICSRYLVFTSVRYTMGPQRFGILVCSCFGKGFECFTIE
jgi:hypothetical protein